MPAQSKSFDPFVSDLLRQSLVRCPAQPEAAAGEQVPAALLYADLSGFTHFAERLAEDSARGAEETQRALNAHFCRVLEVIERWGGSVLKFAGDATIAFWTSQDGGLEAAARRATSCGLEMQASIDEVIAGGQLVLRQRVVVGAGDVWLAHVGGVDGKWEFVASGAPWEQVRAADQVALPGEVVLSPVAWALVAAAVEGTPAQGGCFRVARCGCTPPDALLAEDEPAPRNSYIRYLSRTTRAQLEAGHRDWLAEFRRVSVLFLNVDGIRASSPDALARLHVATQVLQRAINENDGNILQFMMDDKGLVLLGAWGLALSSHDDDAERALTAARSAADGLAALGLASRAGIHTGKVFAGLLGNERHLEYAIIGDPVNAASRLMMHSTGELLCDRATHDAAQRRFAFEPAGQLRVKGRREAIESYRVVGQQRAQRQRVHHTMVGRAREREFVERVLDAACSGAPARLAHVVGEPGVGKSNLSEYLVQQARARGLRCAVGAGDSLRRGDAYFAWASVLPALLGVDELSAASVEGALPDSAKLLPLLNPLLPFAFAETSLTQTLDGAGRADLTRDLLAEIAAAALRRSPLLIVLDDAHWFDSTSWQLLVTLQRRVPALPIVVLSRPLDHSQLPVDARRALDAPEVAALELGPLSFEDTNALIAARLEVEHVSADLARGVFERAEGNPLFTEELLLSLEQQGAIRRMDQVATLARNSERAVPLSFPASIESVVASRIDGLDPAEQLSIKVASVLGRTFTVQALASLRPIAIPHDELLAQLEAMRGSRLLEHEPGGTDDYRFRHAVIHDVVHELLVSEQQRQLHRGAAELYERPDRSPGARNHALLAHHWGLAEEDGKAIDYLELAAQQAHEDHAKLEVVAFLLEALERAQRCPGAVPPARRARWEQLLAEADMDLGLVAQAELHLRHAVTVLDRPLPRTNGALALSLARECAAHALLRARGRRARATGRRAEQTTRTLTAAQCYSTLAMTYYMNHELARMLHATVAGTNLAMRVGGDTSVLARMLAKLAVVAVNLPGVDPEYYSVEALAMAERLGDPGALHEVLLSVATYETGVARFRLAIEHFERAIEISRSIGEIRYWETSLGSLANVYRLCGDFARADRADSQVLRSGFDRNVAQTQVWGFFGRSCSLTHLNRFDELSDLHEPFGKLLDDAEVVRQVSASNVVAYLLTRALLALRNGEDDAAFAAVERSVALLSELDHLQAYMTCVICFLQDALLACWRRRPGDRALSEWSVKADRFVARCARMFPSARAQAFLCDGTRASRGGREAKAALAYRRALEHAQRVDNPFDRACAHHRLSTCSALGPADRDHHRAACDRQLEQLAIARPFAWTV